MLSTRHEFLKDVVSGLNRSPKRISPKYFYDSIGSALFQKICALNEYYLARSETTLLNSIFSELSATLPEQLAVVEFGPGAPKKAIQLLAKLRSPRLYLPIELSQDSLNETVKTIREIFPKLNLAPLLADFTQLEAHTHPSLFLRQGPSLGVMLGSTIGNFDPKAAVTILRSLAGWLGRDAYFLIGIDQIKDKVTLETAYNDSKGETARFNLNLLERVNRELGGAFDVQRFEHLAFFNERESRVEMHLRSRATQTVPISAAEAEFSFTDGETIHTENSYKYTRRSFTELSELAGLETVSYWTDPSGWYGMHLLKTGSRETASDQKSA